MFILKADSISMEVEGKTLFENVSVEIKEKERIAILGENGIGKTTLLKGLLGIVPILSGELFYGISKEEISYMVQENEMLTNLTVRKWMELGHTNSSIKDQMEHYARLLSSNPTDETLIEKYNQKLQKYMDQNGYNWEVDLERSLKRMEIPQELWDTPLFYLSGGQKTRVKLAKVIHENPKLLILDEPTNHLDFETIKWLEKWLDSYEGSVLFISHEREFIDHVATGVLELTRNGTKKYVGGYSSYKKLKEHNLKTQLNIYEKEEQERKKLIETISQYKQWYDKASSAASVRNPFEQKKAAKQATKYKAKEKQLERLEQNRAPKPEEPKRVSTTLNTNEFSGKKMLELEKVSISFEDRILLKDLDLQIQRGERVAIIGSNGSGKTTLLKLMTGVLEPTSGVVKRNPQLRTGYFFQELENLNLENTILDEILTITGITQSDARTILACFLFRKEDVYKKIGNLSMGEKCRVAFVKLYFSDANLLVLDEPTNYFDIPTRETIENALLEYPGSIVIVAHDPYLLREVANKVVSITRGTVTYYPGSYREWENHSTLSTDTQQITNYLDRLQLEYLQLVSEESTGDEDLERNRLIKIKELKKQIDDIQRQLK